MEKSVEADSVSYNTLIDAYAKSRDIAGAERALARMEQKGVAASVVSYSTVVGAYAKRGDTAGAERARRRGFRVYGVKV